MVEPMDVKLVDSWAVPKVGKMVGRSVVSLVDLMVESLVVY